MDPDMAVFLAVQVGGLIGTKGHDKRSQSAWQRGWRLPAISSPVMPRQMPKGFSAR
jgi:hypothetical protein